VYIYIYIYTTFFFIHVSVDGQLNWFHSLVIVNRGAINMGMQASLLYADLHSFGYVPRNGAAELYDSSIFSFLRDFHVDFYSGCINLHPH
jgi:hypothetical protein